MSTFEDATKLLASLTRGEKAQILQMVAKGIGDAYQEQGRISEADDFHRRAKKIEDSIGNDF